MIDDEDGVNLLGGRNSYQGRRINRAYRIIASGSCADQMMNASPSSLPHNPLLHRLERQFFSQ